MSIFLSLSVYTGFAVLGFKRRLAYRVANWAGLFTNAFFLFFRTGVFEAAYSFKKVASGMTLMQALTYVSVSQALIMVIPQWGRVGLEEKVKTGQISMDFIRPVNIFFMVMSERMGVCLYFVVVRCLPLYGIAYLCGLTELPPLNINLLYFVISVLMGSWIANALFFMVETTSFWYETSRGIAAITMGVGSLLSGLLLPLNFFPNWAASINQWLPFAYTLDAPTQIFLQNESAIQRCLLGQGIWVILISLMAQGFLNFGYKRLKVMGG